jgi:hypothetical protein
MAGEPDTEKLARPVRREAHRNLASKEVKARCVHPTTWSNTSRATRIAGRSFHDDMDLAEQGTAWLSHVNRERPSDATGQEPVVRLVEEQATFNALPATAQDYGFFDCVVVSREGVVAILHQSLFGAGASDRTRVNGAHSHHAH